MKLTQRKNPVGDFETYVELEIEGVLYRGRADGRDPYECAIRAIAHACNAAKDSLIRRVQVSVGVDGA